MPVEDGGILMRKRVAAVTLLAMALTPSPGRAELSAEDRAFAATLEARLKALDLERQDCGAGVRAANIQGWATRDRVERRYNSDSRGDLTSLERARLKKAERDVDAAVDDALACEKRVDAERTNISAILANPARLRLENERLRNELRRELLALLTDARSASAMLGAQSGYDEFALKMGAVGNRLQSIRSTYAIPLGRGDHKALGVPISDACNALYAAAGDWKQVHLAAREVASTQAAVARAASWEADFFQRQFREAQLKHAEAQRRFAHHKGIAVAMVQAATSIAQRESTREQAVTVGK
jgi:hypothetical protein